MIDMPSVYEIISAELTLTALSGSGEVDISASRMLTDWDEKFNLEQLLIKHSMDKSRCFARW